MFNKQMLNSMAGALIGAIFGGLLLGLPGARLVDIGTGLTVYVYGILRRGNIS